MDTTTIAPVGLIGIGATAVMDVWLFALARLGVPTSSFGLVGRWVGHFPSGRFVHPAIGKSAPVRGELALGWLTHYVIGIVYSAAFVALLGAEWVREPRLLPALVFGLVTVAAPWFLMQPAMGAGIAASKTSTPLANNLRSLSNHAAFGLGLYLAAKAMVGLTAP